MFDPTIHDDDHAQVIQMLGDVSRRLAALAMLMRALPANTPRERDALATRCEKLTRDLVTLRDLENTSPLYDCP